MNSPAHEVAARPAHRPTWRERLRAADWGVIPVLAGLALIWIFFQVQNQNYLSPRNLSNLVLQIGVVGTLGIGVVLVLLLGEIDLSLGAVSGVCAGVLGVLLSRQGWSAGPAILAAILAGTAIGTLQGLVTVFAGVPSFIVTLAGLMAWQGVQLILIGPGGDILVTNETVRSLASAYLTAPQSVALAALVVAWTAALAWRRRATRLRAGLEVPPLATEAGPVIATAVAAAAAVAWFDAYFGVPFILVILLGVAALFSWLTARTVFGRHLYAIGGSAEAARRAGVNVAGTRVAVFALASALAAVGGVLSASRQFAVSIGTGGGTLLLEAIAAAVIGGTSLFGGRGQVYQALLGALVIGSVSNGLDLLGQPSSTKNIATGVILVFAVAVDALGRRQRPDR